MEFFDLSDVERERAKSGKLYREFIRVPALSMGLYELEAGGNDPQQPHTEEEVYYVVSGRAKFTVGSYERDVATGSILYVPANLEHRFHSICEDLKILVFFAPPESSMQAGKNADPALT